LVFCIFYFRLTFAQPLIGVATRGGLPGIFERTTKKGGSAAAFFLKNQRTWKYVPAHDTTIVELH
jgi:hypothetical protein